MINQGGHHGNAAVVAVELWTVLGVLNGILLQPGSSALAPWLSCISR
jgi:hypothetical protein